MSRSINTNTEGFTLTGMMVGAAIAAVTTLSAVSFFAKMSQNLIGTQLVTARDTLISNLNKSILDSKELERSANFNGSNSAGNRALLYCLKGAAGISPAPSCAPNCCVATSASQPQPFNILYWKDTTGKLIAGTDLSTTYSGQETTATPMRFNANGASCSTGGPDCPIEVVSSFVANCGGASTCSRAIKLQINYSVRMASNAGNKQMSLRPINRSFLVKSSPMGQLPGTDISAGLNHACAIYLGKLYCWGSNASGQLGDGTTTESLTPKQVTALGNEVTAVAAGAAHTCALTPSKVWCWGKNDVGQLGLGSMSPSVAVPTQITSLANGATLISARADHTCIMINGSAWCWGRNTDGQLGNNTTTSNSTPVKVQMTSGGDLSYVQNIWAGGSHSCALRVGELWCWGKNSNGQLGNGNTTSTTRAVQVQNATNTGALQGVLSASTGTSQTCALAEGNVYCWGSSLTNLPTTIGGGVISGQSLTTGSGYTCLQTDDQAMCWGLNARGQLGNGNTATQSTPTAVMTTEGSPLAGVQMISANGQTSCSVAKGRVWCWGANDSGQLGDGTKTDASLPVRVLAEGG